MGNLMTFAVSKVNWSYCPFPVLWFSHSLHSPFVFMRNKARKPTKSRQCLQFNFLQAFDQIGENYGRVTFFTIKTSKLSRQLIDLEILQLYKTETNKPAHDHDGTGMASWSADPLASNPRCVRERNERNSCRWRIEAARFFPNRVFSSMPCLEELNYIPNPSWCSYYGEHDIARKKQTNEHKIK